jgi:hypothetical protein
MKLTLSVAGGFTGLAKECSVDLGNLDAETKNKVIEYFNKPALLNQHRNYTESWKLDDREVPVNKKELPAELQDLYEEMKKGLEYLRKK